MKKRKKNYSKAILTYMLAFALCVTMFPVETRNVKHAAAESAVVIASGTYVRKSATKIVINYYSNSAGTLYYKVYSTDTTLTADELVTNGSEYGTAVVENKINQVTLEEANEMYSGEKYVLLCVKDSEGNLSNVLKIKVEYDVCINEDFDIYKYDNTSAFYANNSSTYDFVEDPFDSTNYVYRINGDNRNNCGVGVIESNTDTIVLEGRVYSGNNLPSFGFGISACTSSRWNEWYNDRAGVVVDNGVWKSHATGVEDTVLTNLSETTAQGNTWYTIRIVYDYSRNLYDVFVNGEKANNEPIQGYSGNSNAGVYLKSSTGQDTYFDDITQYNLKSTNGSVVEFSSDSMTYTKPQTITLSTPLKGRDIYYTTDGTYPDMNSNLYDDGVDIDNTTTIRAVGYYNGKEESIATEETYTFTGAPLIKSESFYRNNATTVNMVIRGDVNGTFYYMVTSLEGSYTAEEIVSSGTEYTGTTHKENTVSMLKLTDSNGISTGEKFVYVCLKDDDGTLSNVLTFDFKHDIYYSDTFETFIAGVDVNENEFFGEYGENYGYALDPSDSDNIAFRSVGTNRPVKPIGLVGSTADTVIVDAKIMSDSDDAFFNYGIAGCTSSRWNEWYYDRAGIVYEDGVWKSRATNRDDVVLTGFENLTVLKDTWYNVRFIYDVNKNVYDIYINGIRGNEESIAGGNDKGNAGIFMTSIAGQSLYLDDVEAYCLSSTDGSIVNFSPESISVTKAQQIKLSTAASGKDIYYTTDGTYPSTESTKYTEEFTVDKTTTVRALAYCDSKAESVAYEETYTFSDKPEISSESWYRSSETAFAAKLMSTVAGTYYYKVTSADKTFTAEEIVSEGTEYTSATQEENAIMNLSLDSNAGIFAGEKHISLCLKDKDGTLSNVIKFDVMHDRQFSEDFEIYTENTTSGGYYPYASGRYYYTTDPNDSDNMVYALSGTDRPVSMVRLTGSDRDTFVMEGSFTSNSDSANMGIGIAGLTSWYYGEWYYDRAGVAVVNGEWMSRVTDKDDEALTNMVGEKVKANTKYTVRIVYDISKNLFDVYIDGKKANDEPIEGGNVKGDAAIFFTSSTGQITYFDDIEGYCLKKTADSVVEFSPTSMTMTKEKE
nr:chitobiase/beta-hexosaminidase C-terminal domain-containing protein [Lachnospiraceae bacterium]